jgi:hypothetical protein
MGYPREDYGGDPKVNKVKLQSLRRQYELLDGRK